VKLSNGMDSTLGNYRILSAQLLGPKAVAFIDTKIAESPNGADEPVVADETQMIHMLSSIEFGERVTK